MTNIHRPVPAQNSTFNTIVVNIFTGAVLILTAFLTFAQFATI